MWESHFAARTWSAIAIFFVVVSSCLKVRSSGGSSLKVIRLTFYGTQPYRSSLSTTGTEPL
jgi:hypothetical protein